MIKLLATPRSSILLSCLILLAVLAWTAAQVGRSSMPVTRAFAPPLLSYSGTMELLQRDGANCGFSASPLTAGSFSLELNLDGGTASGGFQAGGNGTRQRLHCGDMTGDMIWQQDYGGTFNGTYSAESGTVIMNGTLTGSGSHRWENCEENGEAISCPAGSSGGYSFPIDVSGTVDVLAGSGDGTIMVNDIGLVTTGSWTVNGSAITPTPTSSPTPTQTSTATATATATPIHDLSVEHIEAVQAIQCIDPSRGDRRCADNSLPLVRRKSTAVRVYVKLGDGSPPPAPGVTAHLRGFRDSEELAGSPLIPYNRSIVARYPVRRDVTSATVNFRLPDDWTFGEVELRAEVNPERSVDERNYANNEGSLNVNFEVRPTFDVAFVPILYQQPGSTEILEPSSRIYSAHLFMLRRFPIFRINYHQWPSFVWTQDLANAGGADALIRELNRRYLLASDAPDQLAGWVPTLPVQPKPASNAPLGISNPLWDHGQGRVSWQQDVGDGDFTLAHEVAHNLGLRHVNTSDGCSAVDPGTDWPYNIGTIQEEGFDPISMQVVPRTRKDIMTYCSPPVSDIWISPHSYRKLFAGRQQPRAGRPIQERPYLLVSGVFYRNGQAVLEPAYQFSSTRIYDQPSEGDAFCLVLQDDAQIDLDEQCVDVSFVDHVTRAPLEQVGFTFVLPNPANATRLIVRQDDRERAVIEASANAPTVTILSPTDSEVWETEQTIAWEGDDVDGDSLTYALSYSRDDGATWITLVTNLIEPRYTIDAAELAGSSVARIRIIASDGMNTAAVDSEPFSVVDKAPRLTILTPNADQEFDTSNAVVFTGDGSDLEDGLLPEGELIWSSSLDGELGRGTTVTTILSIGEHVITLSAEDSDGNRSTESVLVRVTERADNVYLPIIVR